MQVRTPDGLTIATQIWGNPRGPSIVFIHGFSQCHLSWTKQFAGPLAREFHIVTYDLRGHGESDKPRSAEFYREGHRWADELEAVMDAAQVRTPVLVAWSYGGRVVADYLAHHGPGRIAGINLVGARTTSDARFSDPDIVDLQAGMAVDDPERSEAATARFLDLCSAKWDTEAFEQHLAFNHLVPADIRKHLLGRPLDADPLLRPLDRPVLFTHGRLDRIAPYAASLHGHQVARHSRLSIYDDAGHSPFFEQPERFNAELAQFVRNCVANAGSMEHAFAGQL